MQRRSYCIYMVFLRRETPYDVITLHDSRTTFRTRGISRAVFPILLSFPRQPSVRFSDPFGILWLFGYAAVHAVPFCRIAWILYRNIGTNVDIFLHERLRVIFALSPGEKVYRSIYKEIVWYPRECVHLALSCGRSCWQRNWAFPPDETCQRAPLRRGWTRTVSRNQGTSVPRRFRGWREGGRLPGIKTIYRCFPIIRCEVNFNPPRSWPNLLSKWAEILHACPHGLN